MITTSKVVFAMTLLWLSNLVFASSPPPEVVLGWFTAMEKACSAADPIQSAHYKAGLLNVMDEEPETSFRVTQQREFPEIVKAMEADIAKLNREAFLRECSSLLSRSVRIWR